VTCSSTMFIQSFINLLKTEKVKVTLRPMVSRPVCLVSNPTCGPKPDFYYWQTVACLLMWGALSEERTGLSFTIAAGSRQRSHSQVQVPRDSWPYFTFSDSGLPLPGWPCPRIYITQEQGGPDIPPGTGFPFRRLLRLARLRWRYSTPTSWGGLKTEFFYKYVKMQFVPQRIQITPALQRPTG
jgi:hypothetical protein